jgi:hypothetical protein
MKKKEADDDVLGFIAMQIKLAQLENESHPDSKPIDNNAPKLPDETCGYDESELVLIGVINQETLLDEMR